MEFSTEISKLLQTLRPHVSIEFVEYMRTYRQAAYLTGYIAGYTGCMQAAKGGTTRQLGLARDSSRFAYFSPGGLWDFGSLVTLLNIMYLVLLCDCFFFSFAWFLFVYAYYWYGWMYV